MGNNEKILVCLKESYAEVVPCSGSKNVTYLKNNTHPHMFCFGEIITISVCL